MKHSMKTKIASVAMAAAMAVSMAVPTFAGTMVDLDTLYENMNPISKAGFAIDGVKGNIETDILEAKDFANGIKDGDADTVTYYTMKGAQKLLGKIGHGSTLTDNGDGTYNFQINK